MTMVYEGDTIEYNDVVAICDTSESLYVSVRPLCNNNNRLVGLERPALNYKKNIFFTATASMFYDGHHFEHLRLDGGVEKIRCGQRYLGDINFINVGWKNEEEIVYLSIDPYNGDIEQRTYAL